MPGPRRAEERKSGGTYVRTAWMRRYRMNELEQNAEWIVKGEKERGREKKRKREEERGIKRIKIG